MPIRWKNHLNNIPLTAPLLSEHYESVLRDKTGKSADEIAALINNGVLSEKAS